jgi:hypothetical protein
VSIYISTPAAAGGGRPYLGEGKFSKNYKNPQNKISNNMNFKFNSFFNRIAKVFLLDMPKLYIPMYLLLRVSSWLILKYNKMLLDKFGPLPASEFIIRTFGDAGMSFMDGSSGDKVSTDTKILAYLNVLESTHLIMQNPVVTSQHFTVWSLEQVKT